jgi:hypothetical protein
VEFIILQVGIYQLYNQKASQNKPEIWNNVNLTISLYLFCLVVFFNGIRKTLVIVMSW